MNSVFLNTFREDEKSVQDSGFHSETPYISIKLPPLNSKARPLKVPIRGRSSKPYSRDLSIKRFSVDQISKEQVNSMESEEEERLHAQKAMGFLNPPILKRDPLRISVSVGVKQDGIEFYEQINSSLKVNNKLFTDSSFPPTTKSITDLVEKNLIIRQVVWKRIPEIYPDTNLTVCGDEIGPNDIIQGQLGDCSFLSGLSALAEQKYYIQRLFHSKGISSTGCYSVWLCDSGEWKNIVIDDYIPCSLVTEGYAPRFSKSQGNDMWVLLLEKAYAKLHGSYYNITGYNQGEALSALTGAPAKYFAIKSNSKEPLDQLWEFITGSLEKKFVLTVSSRRESESVNNTAMGVVSTHAYAILDAREVDLPDKSKQRIIKMRNPWGNQEWTGDWGDTSTKWTPEIKEALKYEPKVEDGVFWINLTDFHKHFYQTYVCKVHMDFGYSFLKLGGPKKQSVFIAKMKVKSSGFAYITLQQRNQRHFHTNPTYDYSYARIIVVKVDLKGQIVSVIHGKYQNLQCIVIKRNLESGNYLVLVEVDWIQNVYHEIVLAGYSAVEIEFQEEPLSKYSLPSLYEALIKNYIFSSGDPKVEAIQLKASGKTHEAWKYNFLKFGLEAILLVNKDEAHLHYKIQIGTLINMEIFVPKALPPLITTVIPPQQDMMIIMKAKILKVGAITYRYKCRESYAFSKSIQKEPPSILSQIPLGLSFHQQLTQQRPLSHFKRVPLDLLSTKTITQIPKRSISLVRKRPMTQLPKMLIEHIRDKSLN